MSSGGDASCAFRVEDEHGSEEGCGHSRGRRRRGDVKLAFVVRPADLAPQVSLF